LLADRVYCIEVHIKLNTSGPLVGTAVQHANDGRWWNDTGTQKLDPDGVTWWNQDGILEVWVDGVHVMRDDKRGLRTDKRVRFGALTWSNFFHGGKIPAADLFHWEWSGVTVATEYIGPPKLQPAP
jgi:hypothetical protein